MEGLPDDSPRIMRTFRWNQGSLPSACERHEPSPLPPYICARSHRKVIKRIEKHAKQRSTGPIGVTEKAGLTWAFAPKPCSAGWRVCSYKAGVTGSNPVAPTLVWAGQRSLSRRRKSVCKEPRTQTGHNSFAFKVDFSGVFADPASICAGQRTLFTFRNGDGNDEHCLTGAGVMRSRMTAHTSFALQPRKTASRVGAMHTRAPRSRRTNEACPSSQEQEDPRWSHP
jgi:hypothetical protein